MSHSRSQSTYYMYYFANKMRSFGTQKINSKSQHLKPLLIFQVSPLLEFLYGRTSTGCCRTDYQSILSVWYLSPLYLGGRLSLLKARLKSEKVIISIFRGSFSLLCLLEILNSSSFWRKIYHKRFTCVVEEITKLCAEMVLYYSMYYCSTRLSL